MCKRSEKLLLLYRTFVGVDLIYVKYKVPDA